MKPTAAALALLLTAAGAPAQDRGQSAAADPRRSGLAYLSPATQALQRDDTLNPGMLWVADGASRWKEPAGAPRRSCAGCHGEAGTSMRGVAARYPALDEPSGQVFTLQQRIAACRSIHQQAPAGRGDDEVLLALTTFVAHQSRGEPIRPARGAALDAAAVRGQRQWQQPFGQLAMSCAMCHDTLAGARLAGSAISQAHPTGYPSYRLEWQAVGTLERRMRNCMTGVRAEPFGNGAPEWTALEVFLMRRAAGMPLETPSVRP